MKSETVAFFVLIFCYAKPSLCQSALTSPTDDLLPTDLQESENLDCPKIKDAWWLHNIIGKSSMKPGSSMISLDLDKYTIGHWNAVYEWSIVREDALKVPTQGAVTMLGWVDSGKSNTSPGRTVFLQCYYKGVQGHPFRLNGEYAYSPYLSAPDLLDGQDYSKAPQR